MVRQSGNTVISNKSWNQIVMGSGVQKVQQNSKSKKAQIQKKQQTQTKKENIQQLKQVQQYLEKPRNSINKEGKKFVSTTTYPRSMTSAQLKDLQIEFQCICNMFNANTYNGKYCQKKAWIQSGTKCVISVASCYSLKHKPVPNVIRPQQKRAMNKYGLRFVPKQNKNIKKNPKNNKSQPKFGENRQSSWGAEKAWGKNQPKQIREPPKSQPNKRQQSPRQVPTKVIRTVNQKALIRPVKPLRHRLEAVRKQNQLVVSDDFKYTLNQLVDAFNYFPRKSYSGDCAWKYNKFLGSFCSTSSYFAQRNAPYVPSSRPKVNVTNGLPIYTFNVKPISKNYIIPYNTNLQGVRTEGNGRYFKHWHIGSIWTHYYSKPKARRV